MCIKKSKSEIKTLLMKEKDSELYTKFLNEFTDCELQLTTKDPDEIFNWFRENKK